MPKTLVVDCSVAAKWVLPEPGAADALRLLEEERSGEVSLIAPALLLAEFAGLLAKKVRRKQLSRDQARHGFGFMQYSVLRLFETARYWKSRWTWPSTIKCLFGTAYTWRSQSNRTVRSSPRTGACSAAMRPGIRRSGSSTRATIKRMKILLLLILSERGSYAQVDPLCFQLTGRACRSDSG